jgi:hypothetical protein
VLNELSDCLDCLPSSFVPAERLRDGCEVAKTARVPSDWCKLVCDELKLVCLEDVLEPRLRDKSDVDIIMLTASKDVSSSIGTSAILL